MKHRVILRQCVTTEHVVVLLGLGGGDPRTAGGVRVTSTHVPCGERIGVRMGHAAPWKEVEREQDGSLSQIERRFPLGIAKPLVGARR